MPSTLAWLDHDASAQDRARRILALFQEKSTQDQLGLGGVRDSFADTFFPGTSTIQTRLRYFLFIPWMYRRIEQEEVPSATVDAVGRERELSLIEPLLSEDEEGVFRRTAGGDLKRLPSDVYWGGLRSWGIRDFDASRAQYHRAIDELYRRRRRARSSSGSGEAAAAREVTWHPELPDAPESFPERATMALTREEADFLRDRIVAEHPSSLLAWLTLHGRRSDVSYPWEHPLLGSMTPEHRRTLDHARIFSAVMVGAPILYNRMVSEELGRDDLIEQYQGMHDAWVDALALEELRSWSLDELFRIVDAEPTHSVTPHAKDFIRRWVELTRTDARGIPHSPDARQLVHARERRLKGSRSRGSGEVWRSTGRRSTIVEVGRIRTAECRTEPDRGG